MSRIFLSHSSVNNAEAVGLRDWLGCEGWKDANQFDQPLFRRVDCSDPRRIVAAGSNATALSQVRGDMRAAEQLRAKLIDQLEFLPNRSGRAISAMKESLICQPPNCQTV